MRFRGSRVYGHSWNRCGDPFLSRGRTVRQPVRRPRMSLLIGDPKTIPFVVVSSEIVFVGPLFSSCEIDGGRATRFFFFPLPRVLVFPGPIAERPPLSYPRTRPVFPPPSVSHRDHPAVVGTSVALPFSLLAKSSFWSISQMVERPLRTRCR